MIAVIFEAQPHPGQKEAYLDAAASLRPLLNPFDGFISIERFASLSEPNKVLSLSYWRDEEAVRQWRNVEMHRLIQGAGRSSIFADYRLRVTQVLRNYGMHDRTQAPVDSRQAHDDAESSMSPMLNDYFVRHFLNAEQFAAACGISTTELAALVQERLVPAPSYVVAGSSTLSSHVFGTLPAPGAKDGEYFHRSGAVWVQRAQRAIEKKGYGNAHDALKKQFVANFSTALAALDANTWRLHDCFDASGAPIAAGLHHRIGHAWTHFLHGTFGLCVANPISEAAIAEKEVLQEKLIALSENGNKTEFTESEAPEILALIDIYAQSAMPFSPIDYPISSRKRLVEDLRARVCTALNHPAEDSDSPPQA